MIQRNRNQSKGNRNDIRLRLFIFLIVLGCSAYFFPRWADWSQNSRLDLTLAIVDQNSLMIDSYVKNTGDYAHFNGHYYLDKAPGPVFLAAPVYAAIRPVLRSDLVQKWIQKLSASTAIKETLNEQGTGLLADKLYMFAVLAMITFFVISIPSAMLSYMIYKFLSRIGVKNGWSVVIALIAALATNAYPYSSVFYSHQLVAFLLFGAFFIGFFLRQKRILSFSPWLLIAGLFLGLAVCSEYPSSLIAFAIFIYIAWTVPQKRWLFGLVGAGLLPILLAITYNWAAFGTPLPVGYEYSELYTPLHSQGIFSITHPTIEGLWGLSFGSMRGLFYTSPILLLGLIGLFLWWQRKQFRMENWVCIWTVASLFLFYSSSAMWQGGYAVGPRYLVPMIPFLVAGLGMYSIQWGRYLAARIILVLLLLWSVFIVWAETIGGQSFPDWSLSPLITYSFPRLISGDIARNWGMVFGLHGWYSLVPLIFFMLGMIGLVVRELRLAPEGIKKPTGEMQVGMKITDA